VAQWRRTFGAARLALRVCRSVPLTGLPGRLRCARFSPLFCAHGPLRPGEISVGRRAFRKRRL